MNNDPFIYTIMTYMVLYLGIYILYKLYMSDNTNNEEQTSQTMNIYTKEDD